MRAVLAGTRLHLHVCRVRPGFPLGERERTELLASYQFRQPFLFLFVRAKQQQRPDPDGVMRVNKNRCRRATSPDLLQHFAVGHLRETMSAIFLRRRQAEHAGTSQPIDHATGNIRLPIDLRRIEICIQKFAKFSKSLIELALLSFRDTRIRHHPIRHEMPLEESFRKPQGLGPCKEQFLSLLNLFLSLRVELVHSIEMRATNSSRARPRVQSRASTLCRPKASRL